MLSNLVFSEQLTHSNVFNKTGPSSIKWEISRFGVGITVKQAAGKFSVYTQGKTS